LQCPRSARKRLELFTLKKRSFSALLASGLLLATASLAMTGCGHKIYYYPEYNYAGRPIPPSGLLQRVMAAYTINGSGGGLEILDGLRDLRGNIQDTIHSFAISSYSNAEPIQIFNFPEETTGYVLGQFDGSLTSIDYSTESSHGSVSNFGSNPSGGAAAPNGSIFAGAAGQSGILVVTTSAGTYQLNLPNVYKVAIDQGNSVVLAMVRNSNTLYRVVKLPATSTPTTPPGAVDCEPLLLPVYCVVPVAGTYDHPIGAYFSIDGSTAYILNSGPENGGVTASVSFLQMAQLNINSVPTINPLCTGVGTPVSTCTGAAASPLTLLPVANPIPVPGGVTVALSDGQTLYVAGQQLQASGPYAGLFAGYLTLINLSTYTAGAPISIADGSHTRMLFADNGVNVGTTLWIGSSQCANGVRGAMATAGVTTQAANTNCLTRYVPNVSASNLILPAWTPNNVYAIGAEVSDGVNIEIAQTSGTSASATPSWKTVSAATPYPTTTDGSVIWVNLGAVTQAQVLPGITPTSATIMPVSYPNTNENSLYYGSLTGICWVQLYGKVYTAYGGQIHAFNTIDGSERNNYNITVQGTVLDVAYMDALTNSAN
jgi:hypothetical protein